MTQVCFVQQLKGRAVEDDESSEGPLQPLGKMNMRNLRHSRIGLLLVLAALAVFATVPAAAMAQGSGDPSSAQYTPNIPPGDEGATGGSGSSGGLDSQIGSLPFTGMDLIILAGVALVLTGTGFALRRLSTPRGPTNLT
jgi:hypothetical protein